MAAQVKQVQNAVKAGEIYQKAGLDQPADPPMYGCHSVCNPRAELLSHAAIIITCAVLMMPPLPIGFM